MTQTYLHLPFVYFNDNKSPLQFRIFQDMPLADMITTLNSLLQYPENQRVVKAEYRSPSLDAEGKIKFTKFELKNDDDLKVMWSTFEQYSNKGPIEVDAQLRRSGEDVIRMLQCPHLPVYNNM